MFSFSRDGFGYALLWDTTVLPSFLFPLLPSPSPPSLSSQLHASIIVLHLQSHRPHHPHYPLVAGLQGGPSDPWLLYLYILSALWPPAGLICIPSRILWLAQLRSQKTRGFQLTVSWITEPAAMLWQAHTVPWRVLVSTHWPLLPTASSGLAMEWATLESKSFSPKKAFGWCNPGGLWTIASSEALSQSHLSHFQIPNPWEMWHSKCVLF